MREPEKNMPSMPSTGSNVQLLFSYGTLQLESVQLATFGRKLVGTADGLPGYEQSLVEIDDTSVVATSRRTHHPIVRFTGSESDVVYGTVFEVTEDELQYADAYEVRNYKRVSVTLLSGVRAWVYVDACDETPSSCGTDECARPETP
jgi:Gamma-glutamyl cyclotransferase, AIG2-like